MTNSLPCPSCGDTGTVGGTGEKWCACDQTDLILGRYKISYKRSAGTILVHRDNHKGPVWADYTGNKFVTALLNYVQSLEWTIEHLKAPTGGEVRLEEIDCQDRDQ